MGKNISYDAFENFANLRQNGTNNTKTHQRQPVSVHEYKYSSGYNDENEIKKQISKRTHPDE